MGQASQTLQEKCIVGGNMKRTKNGANIFDRVQAMVVKDKFNYGQSDFFSRLTELVCTYYNCDGITVDTHVGSSNNLVIKISVQQANQINLVR